MGLIAPLAGFTVAIVSVDPRDELRGLLEGEGARIVRPPASRIRSAYPTQLRRLIDLITSQLVDAVTFTSPPAVRSLLRMAGGDTDAMLASLRSQVLVGCVGPVTADPLVRRGVPVLGAAGAGRGCLVRALVEELPRRTVTLRVAGAQLVILGHAAVVEGVFKPLTPAQMAILRALAAAPGRVLARAELVTALPRGADEHTVEMTVARLRAALGRSSFIHTVVRRGYQLRVD